MAGFNRRTVFAILLLASFCPGILRAADPQDYQLVRIPGGTFQMGCDTNLFPEGSGEIPVHTVTLSAFYIAPREVTKSLWDEVAAWAATNNYDISTNSALGKATNHPAQSVTWDAAVKWCNARSEMEGRTPCFYVGGGVHRSGTSYPDCVWTNNGYRLLTEAEWEYAARAGSQTNRVPWHDTNTIDHSRANYKAFLGGYDLSEGWHPIYATNASPYTSPSANFAPNAYGLYDMAGNVFEWCWDSNGTYTEGSVTNPTGPGSFDTRLRRGGSWDNDASYARVTARAPMPRSSTGTHMGFRLAATFTNIPGPVMISGPFVTFFNTTNAEVVWQTDVPADGSVQYGRGTASFEGGATNTESVTVHQVMLTGLLPGTTYRYRAKSTATNGTSVTSADCYFKTQSAATNLVVSNLLVYSQWPGQTDFHVDASGALDRVEYYVDGNFAGIAYPPYSDFNMSPLSLDGVSLNPFTTQHITAVIINLDGSTSTQEAERAELRTCFGREPPGEFEILFPPERHYITIPGLSVNTTLTFQVYAAELISLGAASKTGSGMPGPIWDRWDFEPEYANAESVEFILDYNSLGIVSNSVPGTPFLFQKSSAISGLSTGQHVFAALIRISNECSRLLTRQFHVSRQSSWVDIERTVVREQSYFGVGLTFRNSCSNDIRILSHTETVRGFYPLHQDGASSSVTSVYDSAENTTRVIMTFKGVTGELAPGESFMHPYQIVPCLSTLPDDYQIGEECVTVFSDDYETYSRTNGMATAWVSAGMSLADAVSSAFRTSDYLIVTSPRNLALMGRESDRDGLLAELSRLAQVRGGVLGFYDAAPSIMTAYNSHEQIAAGCVFGWRGERDELFHTEKLNENDYLQGYVFPKKMSGTMPRALGSNTLHDSDALAVGNLLTVGGTHMLDEILLACGNPSSPSQGMVRVFMFMPDTGTLDAYSFRSSYEAGDGFAAGDVTAHSGDEAVIAQEEDGLVEIYSGGGETPVASFTSTFRDGDGLITADVIGNAREEILVVKPGADRIDFYDLNADPAPSSPAFSFDTAIYAKDLVAAGDVHGFSKAEILIGNPGSEILTAYHYVYSSVHGGSMWRLWQKDVVMASDDTLLVADFLPGGKAEAILARKSAHDNLAPGDIEVLPAGAASASHDRYGLDDLFERGGAWSSRLAPDWSSEGYLLLVGETEIIPSFSYRYEVPGENIRVTLADAAYANTAGNRERPELSMGRIIGSSIEALKIPIVTSLALHAGTNTLEQGRSYVISGFREGAGGGAADVDFASRRRRLASTLSDDGFEPVTQEWTEGDGAIVEANFFARAPGMNIINFAGHGDWGGWDILHSDEVFASFVPTEVRPIVIGNTCLTGKFSPGLSFAERWLTKGAAAYIGSTEVSFGTYTVPLSQAFYNRLDSATPIGRAFRNAKRARAHVGTNSEEKYNDLTCMEFYLYGDPKITVSGFAAKGADFPRGGEPVSGPTNLLVITVPMYSVTNLSGTDFVTLPGDLDIAGDGLPIIPIYREEVSFPAGHPVQDVELVLRDGLHETNGLVLPTGTCAADSGRAVSGSPVLRGASPEWWPTNTYKWETDKNPDGSYSLFVTVYPFYYNSNTTDAVFYSNYTFSIDYAVSDISINRLMMDKDVYDTNDAITAMVWLHGTNDSPLNVVLEPVLTRTDSDDILFLPLTALSSVRGVVSASIEWDADDYPPGDYILTLRCKQEDGTLLDYDTVYFSVGYLSGSATDVFIEPEDFMVGDEVDITAHYENQGDEAVDAELVILVRDADGNIVEDFRLSVTNWMPGTTQTFTTGWTATLVPRDCELEAYIIFDSDQGALSAATEWENAPLTVTELGRIGASSVFSWPSVEGRSYRLEASTNLTDAAFGPLVSGLPATPPLNVFTNPLPDSPVLYWRVGESW
ncbi:MAG: SUMF1/EgtB/PvdO family nonheme iron enzyme [Kiritimatiellia bacterium]